MLFLLLLLTIPQSEALIGTITDVLSFGVSTYGYFNDAHDAYNKWKHQTTLDDVLNAVGDLSSKIDKMEARIASKLDNLFEKLVTQLPRLGQRARAMEELSTVIEEIDFLYEFFEVAVTNASLHVNNRTMEIFVESITSLDPGHLMTLLNKIHGLIAPKRTSVLRESFLELIDEEAKGRDQDIKGCGNKVARPTLISEIYTTLVVTEVRAMMMTGFSYAMLELLHNVSYAAESNFAIKKLKDRCDDYLDTFTNAHYPPSEMRNCDPEGGWVKGESYTQFDRFLTKYIVSGEGFNESPSCEKVPLPNTNQKLVSCDANLLCTPENKCRGHLGACEAENYAWICPVEDGSSPRRYWDVSTQRGRWTGLGREHNCKFDEKLFLRGHSDPNDNYCSIYYCDCYEDNYDSNALRTMSYREQIADIKNNKIITGLKFVNSQQMIHVQIQQGTVLAQGNVDPETIEWKPLENITFDDAKTMEKEILTFNIQYENGTKEVLRDEIDYGVFTVDEDTIDLDDVKLPRDYLLTGIRFGWDAKSKNLSRRIELHGTAYDYLTGRLILDNPKYPPKWFTPEDMKGVLPAYDEPRVVYDFGDTDLKDPSVEKMKTEPAAGPNSAVFFMRTGMVYDAGQTTVPLVDIREVVATPPFALGQVGLFLTTAGPHRHGFLAFRLTIIDTIATLQV